MKSKFSIAHGGHGCIPIAIGCRFMRRKKAICTEKRIDTNRNGTLRKLILPDRVLFYASGKAILPLLDKRDRFDNFLYLDPWREQNIATDLNLKYYMGNFMGDVRKSTTSTRIIWDSGGLQLARGRIDFIDPRKLAEKLTKNSIYAGVTLDIMIPMKSRNYAKRHKIGGILTRENTKLIKNSVNGTKILNIIHGYSIEARKIWYENSVVNKEDVNWCLADIRRMPSVEEKSYTLLSDLDSLKQNFKPKDLWLHLLGVASHKYSVVLIPVSSKVGKITADATTALAGGNNGLMFIPPFHGTLSTWRLGKFNDSWGSLIPCNCPVCQIVGSTWVYSKLSLPLIFHNIAVLNGWADNLSAVFTDEGIDGYLSFLRKMGYGERLVNVIDKTWESIESGKNKLSALRSTFGYGNSFSISLSDKEKHFEKVVKTYRKFHKI